MVSIKSRNGTLVPFHCTPQAMPMLSPVVVGHVMATTARLLPVPVQNWIAL